MSHARRLAALEVRTRHENRRAFSDLFARYGDPRSNPTFPALPPERQRTFAWLFDVWTDDPRGFLQGFADPKFAPQPPELAGP